MKPTITKTVKEFKEVVSTVYLRECEGCTEQFADDNTNLNRHGLLYSNATAPFQIFKNNQWNYLAFGQGYFCSLECLLQSIKKIYKATVK